MSTYRIPILAQGKTPCRKYMLELERAIESDGCTGVIDVYHECCIYHDLAYRFHIDIHGNPIERVAADCNFRACIQSKSLLKWFNPVSWSRYAGVRWFGNRYYSICPKEFVTYIFQGDK